MPTDTSPVLFSDVLGAMVSSIAKARQIADVAAVNLAYAYQRHDLLKGMAVPRLRFRSIDVSLPVLIRQVHPAKAPELDEATAVSRRVTNQIRHRATLVVEKLRFEAQEESSEEKRALLESLAILWEKLMEEDTTDRLHAFVVSQIERRVTKRFVAGVESPASNSESAIRTEIAASVRSGIRLFFREILHAPAEGAHTQAPGRLSLKELKRTDLFRKVIESAAAFASDICFRTPSVPAELEMVVCTDDIKNMGGGPDSVTRIRFTLLEEGLEWVEDDQGARLIAE